MRLLARFFLRAFLRAANKTAARDTGRKDSEQNYINIPSALGHAMGFAKGETVAGISADLGSLILSRREVPPNPVEVAKRKKPCET